MTEALERTALPLQGATMHISNDGHARAGRLAAVGSDYLLIQQGDVHTYYAFAGDEIAVQPGSGVERTATTLANVCAELKYRFVRIGRGALDEIAGVVADIAASHLVLISGDAVVYVNFEQMTSLHVGETLQADARRARSQRSSNAINDSSSQSSAVYTPNYSPIYSPLYHSTANSSHHTVAEPSPFPSASSPAAPPAANPVQPANGPRRKRRLRKPRKARTTLRRKAPTKRVVFRSKARSCKKRRRA